MQLINDKLVTLPELATAFGVTEDYLRRNHRRLHLESGMPEKCQLGWVWPRRSIERWIEGELRTAAIASDAVETATGPETAATALAANQNARLRRRYAEGRA